MNSKLHSMFIEDLLRDGANHMRNGAPHLALDRFKNALAIDPDHPLAHYNTGVALYVLECFDQAITHYRQAIALVHDFQQAYHNLAQAYVKCQNDAQAKTAYQRALMLNPNDANSAYNLGLLYQKTGDQENMLAAYQQSLKSKPDFAEVYAALGVFYNQQDRLEEAMACLDQALRINWDSAEAHLNMGIAIQKSGAYRNGLAHYQYALKTEPNYAPARWLSLLSLPMLYQHEDEIDIHRNRFAANLNQLIASTPLQTTQQQREALKGVGTTTNFYLQYQCRNDLTLQMQYGRFVHDVMATNYPQWSQTKKSAVYKPRDRIRIGYVSTFMHNHTIGIYLLGWLQAHANENFDIYGYHVGKKIDSTSHCLQSLCSHFHHIPGDLESAARQIDGDNLHILTYTDIGMDPLTTQLAALRLAPIQCKGWGHPVTTGLPTIDYYLSSDLMEPDKADVFYSESLVRLPNLALNYRPPDLPHDPKTRSMLGIPEDRFVYLSTQSIFKYLPQHDDIYPRIAKAVPQACFIFIGHNSHKATTRFKNRLASAFADAGLDAHHYCHFTNKLEYNDFLSLNLASDVLLDSFEWSGGKTTLEAICCGLPVVTSPGRFMRGRHAYAILNRMALTTTIAENKSAYCAIAKRLANDPTFYADTRKALFARRSILFNDQAFVQGLNRFYHEIMWE